jgi:hypothetical protein
MKGSPHTPRYDLLILRPAQDALSPSPSCLTLALDFSNVQKMCGAYQNSKLESVACGSIQFSRDIKPSNISKQEMSVWEYHKLFILVFEAAEIDVAHVDLLKLGALRWARGSVTVRFQISQIDFKLIATITFRVSIPGSLSPLRGPLPLQSLSPVKKFRHGI